MKSEVLKLKEEVAEAIEAVVPFVLAEYIKSIGEKYNRLHKLVSASYSNHGLPLYNPENMEVVVGTSTGKEVKLSLATILAHIDSLRGPENERETQPSQKKLH